MQKTTRQKLLQYVDSANKLAEQVKKNIQKDGCIDDKTVLALNEYIIAANEIEDGTNVLRKQNDQLN